MSQLINICGNVFGKWTVTHQFVRSNRQTLWLSRCACGTEKWVDAYTLRAGNSVSCGCYRHEAPSAVKTHGRSRTPEYYAWNTMKQRCLNPRSSSYPRYGGRGITICENWIHYENFLRDMGSRPLGMSLDRIDNLMGYSKDNCRWATPIEQANNRRPRSCWRKEAA